MHFAASSAVGESVADPEKYYFNNAAGPTVNPYGRSKFMIEQILADYQSAYRLNSVCLRYFNACGADESAVIGELRDPETHLIPRALMALQGYVSDFAIFGTDYDTLDGTAIRDYIHVDDLAAAHVAALNLLFGGGPGGVFNVGTGMGYSVMQILKAIHAETGRHVPLLPRDRRAGDPAILVANPANCERRLGFKASRSDLSRIIRTAWAWHQKAHPRHDL